MLAAAGAAVAQTYPVRPVRMILSFPPGGGTDILARTVSQRLTAKWGQPVVVDNRAGGNGVIGARAAITATPDGYTLYVGSSDHMILVPNLFDNLPFETLRDLQPITSLANQYYILVVHPSVPAATMKEFIALARAKPGALNFVSPGTGTGGHLTGEFFQGMTGVKLTHVPYKGSAPAIADLLAGQDVTTSFASMASVVPHIKSGRLRAIALTSTKRLKALPDVMTTTEAGLPNLVVYSWNGVFAPVGTGKPLVDRLSNEVAEILRIPEVAERLIGLGLDPTGGTPAEFTAVVKADLARWGKIIKDSGIERSKL
ncbi:MAG: tripartite tricarboxylate transporter substrate binding protein [Gemmatimonadaceae bacterium]|nr:tripartite tricarboxylate transporter substrate binding protein [Gemmatimonadaceae bacterium]